jgi:polysaccharide export outer membrane protein
VPTAVGLTPAETAQLATASFSPNSIRVNVVGEVTRAGVVEVPPNTPLNQAILAAGGFNNRARRNNVDLVRLNTDGTVTRRSIAINFANGVNDQNNPMLQNNDVIIVNRSGLASVGDTLGSILNPLSGIFSIFNLPFQFLRIFQ